MTGPLTYNLRPRETLKKTSFKQKNINVCLSLGDKEVDEDEVEDNLHLAHDIRNWFPALAPVQEDESPAYKTEDETPAGTTEDETPADYSHADKTELEKLSMAEINAELQDGMKELSSYLGQNMENAETKTKKLQRKWKINFEKETKKHRKENEHLKSNLKVILKAHRSLRRETGQLKEENKSLKKALAVKDIQQEVKMKPAKKNWPIFTNIFTSFSQMKWMSTTGWPEVLNNSTLQ